jgi:organic hydroperoxide reductase OsmC/OhrA
MKNREHRYRAHLVWEGNRGDGTADYETYGREHRLRVAGKPDLLGSADPTFRGDPSRLNPEDLFLAAIASCHMLSYLALCARQRISVVAYEDHAWGVMREDGRGGGRFEEVVLEPLVTVADARQVERAVALHERAHELCFIASSCSVPIRHLAKVSAEARAAVPR